MDTGQVTAVMNHTDSNRAKEKEAQQHCNRCGKLKRSLNKGSFTSWIFRPGSCTCANDVQAPKSDKKPQKNRITGTDLKTPEIEKYEILDFVGQGGMGSVYKVQEDKIGETFAVKVLRPEFVPDHIAVKRFEQEAIAASKLTHPNLVRVFGHGKTADGSPYLIMEYLDGESLEEYMERVGRLEPEIALEIFIQTCGALTHAHTKGVIHRDLKPANIILTFTDSGGITARVVDFGIAKIQHDMRSTQDLTETGSVLGSPAYMSPEQCLGAQIDLRADIYSMGCVLFETLTGEELYSGENPVQVIAKHLEETPEKFDSANIRPKRLKDVISTCIQKDIDKRYQSAVELGIDLQRIKEGKQPEFCMLTEDKFEQWTKKKPVLITALSMFALIVIGGALTLFPKIELMSLIRNCLMLLSFLIFGFSVSKILKIISTCTIRTAKIIDIAAAAFFMSLLAGCFYIFGYCMSQYSGFYLKITGLETGLANSVALTAFLAILYLLLDKTKFKSHEYLQGRYDTKVFRASSSMVLSIGLTLLSFGAISKASDMLPKVESASEMESKWVRSKETDYLSKLVIANDNAFDNQDSKIAGLYKYARGVRYFQQGNIQYALDDFDSVIKRGGPVKNDALVERAVILFCHEKNEKAMQDINSVLTDDPDNRNALVTKGLLSLAKFDSKSAVLNYSKAAKFKTTTTSTVLTYLAYVQNGEKEKGIRILKEYLKDDKENRMIQYMLGSCSYNDLIKTMVPDTKCNTEALIGWDLLLKGKVRQSNQKFQYVIAFVDKNGFKWHHGIFYGLAKAGYTHNQKQQQI